MNERPTLDAVKAAIKTALTDANNPDRKAASDWLDSLKSSPHAWEVCDQLLIERESIEISYLAAHMLRHKIYKNFNELPLECYTSLKDSILNHLKSNEDYAVQGQLTMAISDLTLLLKSWQNPVEELAQKLGLDQPLANVNLSNYNDIHRALHHRIIFADILHQMCDLNHNNTDRPSSVGAKRREEYEDYLISKTGQAITWWLSTMTEIEDMYIKLQTVYASSQQSFTDSDRVGISKCLTAIEKLIGQIYLCFSAWLRIFDEQNMNDSLPILDSAFKYLKEPNCTDRIHNYAVEVVISTANYAEDSALEYMINHLVTQAYTLEPAFCLSVRNEDAGKSCNFARIFSAVAEVGCQKFIIEEKDFKLLDLLLNCMNHYDFEIVEETYHFWWYFLELVQVKLRTEDYVPYIPYINRFVMNVTKLCQFDPDEDSVIATDADIHAFRVDSAEIIYSVMFVAELERFLRDNQIIDNFRVPLASVSWEKLESILFLVSSLNQMLTDSDNQLRMELFKLIISQQIDTSNPQQAVRSWPAINFNLIIGTEAGQVHPQIVATTLQVIGTIEGLFNEAQDCLAIAINYILTAMNHPIYRVSLMKYAAASLATILSTRASCQFGTCSNLLDIIRNLCLNLDQYETASSDLLRGAACLASVITDPALCDQFLCDILSQHIQSIKSSLSPTTLTNNQLNVPTSTTNSSESFDPLKYLERLSGFFHELRLSKEMLNELKNFISLIDNSLWPVILEVLEKKASATNKTIERTCRTIRYLIRCIKPEWMIQRVADTMVNLYKTYPQNSSPLYICSILVDEFANRSPEINSGLFQILEIFCQLTFTLLELNTAQGTRESLLTMKSYPETIDDMMRLFNRFLQKCPDEFLGCSALANIIELSISSLRIDHHEANGNVTKFVNAFIEISKKYDHIREAIANVLGARITDTVIRACLLDVPSSLIPDEAQILITLSSFDENLFRLWVEASVKSLPRANIQGIESVTEDQLDEFRTTITTSGSVKGLVNCLRAFARQYS